VEQEVLVSLSRNRWKEMLVVLVGLCGLSACDVSDVDEGDDRPEVDVDEGASSPDDIAYGFSYFCNGSNCCQACWDYGYNQCAYWGADYYVCSDWDEK
jgi:hypothetical protein